MKKLFIYATMALFTAAGFSACSNSGKEGNEKEISKDSALVVKIDNKEDLTAQELSSIIDYVGEYSMKAQKYLDILNMDPNNAEAKTELTKLQGEYPFVATYRTCISQTPLNKLTEENKKLINKYAGYLEFTAPAGYEVQTNGNGAAGFIVDGQIQDSTLTVSPVDSVKTVEKGW